LRHFKFLTDIYLRSRSHQIRLDPASRPLIAFRTKYGFYEFTMVLFGLTNAPSVFIVGGSAIVILWLLSGD